MNLSKRSATIWSIIAILSTTTCTAKQAPYPVDWKVFVYPGWPEAKFSSGIWRLDKTSRQMLVKELIETDLPGKTREQIYELLGEPDRIRGVVESYDLDIRYPKKGTLVLNLKYVAGSVSAWQIELDFADSDCCGLHSHWRATHSLRCWYLPGGRANFPVLSCVEKSRHEDDRVFYAPSNLHF
jgi:hypothetical protein